MNRLYAQDIDVLHEKPSQPGLLVDEMPGVGNLLPVQDLLSTEESLSTESGSGPAPGDIPVDGGLSLLLAAGAAYGARRVRSRKAIK